MNRGTRSMRRAATFTLLICLPLWALPAAPAYGWDEEGHVIVTRLAWKAMPDRMPPWLRDEGVRFRLEYLSSEPDRWRGQKSVVLDHINDPDHYLDIEQLADYGLDLRNLPLLRRQFTDRMAVYRANHPAKFTEAGRREDKAYTRNIPGLLPYTIIELQWKLAASWTTLKTYEAHADKVTPVMMDNARQNIIHQMGILSHFVGDGCQPLHLTVHYNGWVGDNPGGYTTSRKFHSYIDSGVIAHHNITPDSLLARARKAVDVSAHRSWPQILDYLEASFRQMEPLYALEKSGELNKKQGRAFIEDRLLEGGATLAGIWAAAFDAAVIDDFRVRQFEKKAARSQAPTPVAP